ncbi:MAG: TIGR01777 family oxidoreductase [Streptosporangiaceae bacterium]
MASSQAEPPPAAGRAVTRARVAVTGSSGLIGSALVASLRADGYDVVRLVRRQALPGTAAAPSDSVSRWDPGVPDGGLDPAAFVGITAVVHLAGAGIGDKRWTAVRKAEIRDSRVKATRALTTGLAKLAEPPATLLCGSAIGWYGDAHGRDVDENSPAGSGFLPELVRDWEAAADPASSAGIRTVHLRSGLVLAGSGGTLAKMVPVFRLGLGTRLGSGTQYMSWISLADEIGAIRFLFDQPDLAGPVNLTAPNPVTNAEFTAALDATLGRPKVLRIPLRGLRLPSAGLSVPSQALRLALGEMAGELLASARVLPHRLLEADYHFSHPYITPALRYALG